MLLMSAWCLQSFLVFACIWIVHQTVRMQADGRLVAKGGVARYSGVIDAFGKIVKAVRVSS